MKRSITIWEGFHTTIFALIGLLVCLTFSGPSQAGYLVAWGRGGIAPGDDYVAIDAGGTHTVALTEDGCIISS